MLAALGVAPPATAEDGTNPSETSPNMFHAANRPPTPPSGVPQTTNSDLAFFQAGASTAVRQDLVAMTGSGSSTPVTDGVAVGAGE